MKFNNYNVETEEASIKQFIYQQVFSNIEPTAFKTIEQQHKTALQLIDEGATNYKNEFYKGMQLLAQHATPLEFSNIQKILSVVTETGQSPQKQDMEYLEEIARRQFIAENYEEASCIYRFLIQISLNYSNAWVGWALSEQNRGEREGIASIYDLALACLPNDYYILLFAAEYFITIDQKEKASEMLHKAKEQLTSLGETECFTMQEINHLISLI